MNKIRIGTHIFGKGSPINMWSTIVSEEIESDLDEVKSLGFDNVVLLIPWSCFQTNIYKAELDKEYLARLKKIFTVADEKELKVILRIGYLWDSTPSNMFTYERFMKLPYDYEIKKQWCWFLKALYQQVKQYKSFSLAFISWEDFYWPIYRHYPNVKNDHDLLPFLQGSGFLEYINELKVLSLLGDINLDTSDYKNLLSSDSGLYSFFTHYYDNVIMRKILDMSAMSFPNVEYEYRVDPEWIKDGKTISYHNWNTNFYKSTLPVIYYHSNIGTKPSNVMNTTQANYHLKSLLERYAPMRRLGQKLPFIDQLNFFDDTYANWGSIDVEHDDEYAEKVFETLSKFSSGYAIWGLRDWRKNIAHNPVFERYDEGWVIDGSYSCDKNKLILKSQCKISQAIPHLALDEGERFVFIEGFSNSSAKVTVSINEDFTKSFEIPNGNFSEEIKIPESGRISNVELNLQNGMTINEISVFGRSFSQGFADSSGNLYPIAKRLVELQNEYLKS
ncbi:hypothetical protein C6Y40_19265 [Alteromonas alba]|uniref:Glycoside hydrolase family 5 domain-containing protein n=1 Tax=Alteromonas alba TaxID=2079529 RepID=A0A2S9V667_9ALTE|nr:hypothetical protein [Alteromonas alba]PRO71950.1 hypothetical protein C6Y40_19265 [Alteromonas alba]